MRPVHLSVELIGYEVSDDLAELHVVALIHQDVADPSNEIEPELHLAAALDGCASEHLTHDVALIDEVALNRHGRNEPMTDHQRDHKGEGENLQPTEVPPQAGAEGPRGRPGRRVPKNLGSRRRFGRHAALQRKPRADRANGSPRTLGHWSGRRMTLTWCKGGANIDRRDGYMRWHGQ